MGYLVLSFDRIHVAHVRWLSVPEYPTGTPMVVRLNKNKGRPRPPPHDPCIVPYIDIDPSKVTILHEGTLCI